VDLIMMIFDVTLDQISCNFVSHRPCKISILPKFPSPQLFLYFRKLIKNLTRRYTLQHSNYMRYRIPRWKTQKYMDMIWSYSLLLNFIPMVQRNVQKDFLYSLANIFSLNPFTVFRRPYQMAFRVVHCMGAPSNSHAVLISHFFCLWQIHTFHPRPQDGVFRCDLNKPVRPLCLGLLHGTGGL